MLKSKKLKLLTKGKKQCSTCKEVLPLADFNKDSSRTDGLSYICKLCRHLAYTKRRIIILARNKLWRTENKEKLKMSRKKIYNENKKELNRISRMYYRKNKNKILKQKKKYGKQNKEKINLYHREQYKTNINFRLGLNIRNRINGVLNGRIKGDTAMSLLGCSIDYLKNYLESKFKNYMNWNNHGKRWEIDHIRPCCTFDLSKLEEQKICFHYTNLQPLCISKNRRKRA